MYRAFLKNTKAIPDKRNGFLNFMTTIIKASPYGEGPLFACNAPTYNYR